MRYLLYPLLVLALVFLSSCKEEGEDGSAGNAASGLAITGTPTKTVRQGFPFSSTFSVSGGVGELSYTLENQPTWMGFDRNTLTLSGTADSEGTHSGVRLTVTDDTGSKFVEFDLEVEGDPLFEYAWHLENTGQRNFAQFPGTPGFDLNVLPVLLMGISGKGVRVAVSDTGLDIDHPDLVGNVDNSLNKNYGLLDEMGNGDAIGGDPTPELIGIDKGDHGTSVGGIISAKGWNGIGSRGVAPDSILAGLNYLPHQLKPGVLEDQASWISETEGYEVFNQSFGSTSYQFRGIDSMYLRQLIFGVSTYRNSKGSIYVKAAGNNGSLGLAATTDPAPPASPQSRNNVISLSANVHEDNTHPYSIVVSATNAKGQKASYSSFGSNIWVSAPGGEYGTNNPAILTTDMAGCVRGYSPNKAKNAFDVGNTKNQACDYTSSFNGTSSAAPNVAGVIALMLEANPDLSYRDVKHILASTARKIHEDIGVVTEDFVHPSGATLYSAQFRDWTENAAGYSFHEFYGFGMVDAHAAVVAAKNYQTSLGTLKQTVTPNPPPPADPSCLTDFCDNDTWKYASTDGLPAAIPENGGPLEKTIVVDSSDNLTIEAVQIELSVTHAEAEDIQVELVSPSGTISQVLYPTIVGRAYGIGDPITEIFNQENLVGQRFLTNAFYGESAAGTWTLRISDAISADLTDLDLHSNTGVTGTLTEWKLNVIGH